MKKRQRKKHAAKMEAKRAAWKSLGDSIFRPEPQTSAFMRIRAVGVRYLESVMGAK